jgi:hypothetical protein
MNAGKHRVGAFVGVLQHVVGSVVDDVGIIAGAADQQIDAGIAGQRVRVGVAVALQVGAADQHQVLHVRG